MLETSKYKILDHCSISKGIVTINGEILLRSETTVFKDFAKEIYNRLKLDYPKFFKMDNLSKLAFLSTELLSQNNPIAKDTAVILSNVSSSLDTDIKHDAAIQDYESYHPSPAVFVYTLPNICLGEISIRHQLHTENSFFIFERFQPEFLVLYAENLLDSGVAKELICGWTEIFGNDYSAFLYRVSANGNGEHSIKNLQNLYNKWNH